MKTFTVKSKLDPTLDRAKQTKNVKVSTLAANADTIKGIITAYAQVPFVSQNRFSFRSPSKTGRYNHKITEGVQRNPQSK